MSGMRTFIPSGVNAAQKTMALIGFIVLEFAKDGLALQPGWRADAMHEQVKANVLQGIYDKPEQLRYFIHDFAQLGHTGQLPDSMLQICTAFTIHECED
jgi:hypothetical protein